MLIQVGENDEEQLGICAAVGAGSCYFPSRPSTANNLCTSVQLDRLCTETQNAEGVRKFKPRVGSPTLGFSCLGHSTLKAFANSFGVPVSKSYLFEFLCKASRVIYRELVPAALHRFTTEGTHTLASVPANTKQWLPEAMRDSIRVSLGPNQT